MSNVLNTDRREFLHLTLATAAGLAAGSGLDPDASARAAPTGFDPDGVLPPGKKSVLILGGTNFLGPHVVTAAKARAHRVTLFNRGITEARKGTPIDADEKLVGDRDPDKGDGLTSLKGRKFDAVVDTSGFFPRHVTASAEVLAPNVERYIFISTISVYAKNATPNLDEADELGKMDDPTLETMGDEMQYYGPLKALCERAAEAAMPGRVANVRPGYIVGPGDPSDRFTYWPVRFGKAGEADRAEVLVPGNETDPVQFIDARDLAEWIVRLIETGTSGVFNATGPVGGLTMGDLVKSCRKAAGGSGSATWVPYAFLAEHGLPAGALPIALPPDGETAGFHTRRIDKAVAAGFKSRPPEETCRDTLAWWPKEVERRAKVTAELKAKAERERKPAPELPDPAKLRVDLPAEKEKELLEAWRSEGKEKK